MIKQLLKDEIYLKGGKPIEIDVEALEIDEIFCNMRADPNKIVIIRISVPVIN